MSAGFTQAYLPDMQKRQLCLDLLHDLGVKNVTEKHDGELHHSCQLPGNAHPNGDKHPSASLNWRKLTFNCLTADTVIKTYDGEFPISELAGKTARLLDGKGQWVDAPVKHYGQDRIYRVTLSRNGVRRVVETTADHRWYVRKRGAYQRGKTTDLVVTSTLELKPEHRIPSIWPMTRTGRVFISPIGVMAGFIFGDGAETPSGARANFYGPKDDAMTPYFTANGLGVRSYGRQSMTYSGLPRSWKRLPTLDEGLSYLWGWLAGYFAADGCVAADGHSTLACASEATLRFVVTLCDRLGIATYTLSGRERVGLPSARSAEELSSIYTLSFRGSTLIPEFFLIPAHRARYEAAQQHRRYERTHWWVTSVEETDRVEDVYCAEVPTTHSFVLEGNILTGNCFGCGQSGGLLWFIAFCRGDTDVQESRRWLEDRTSTSQYDVGAVLELLRSIANYKPDAPQSIPNYHLSLLETWKTDEPHPYLTEGIPELGFKGREIPESTLEEFCIGYDFDDERIIIPMFFRGKLVGWQGRRIDPDIEPKYKNSPDAPRARILYNYNPKAETAIVVESPMSVLRHYHHQPHLTATFGAKITDEQLSLLHNKNKVILWLDNDPAGWSATRVTARKLRPYTSVWVVASPYDADPADLTDEVVDDLITRAVPAVVWNPPVVSK